jgi:phospholipid/cholesterol/gamma-HCH transport system ATP-binding protein
MNANAIEFNDVVKSFVRQDGGQQMVLEHVSFAVPAGKTTVIAGGSGQGKSVTLKLILGLMTVDSGQILVDGTAITGARGRDLEQLRTRFGVLFQGAALFDSLTVFENVALPLRERTRLSEAEIETQVGAILGRLELSGHEEKYPAQLSGGMRKRVGLARALQLSPQIMLFDEPTTGLDPVMTQDIYALFVKTQRQAGYTAVIVSHDIPRVFDLADQIIILNNGKTAVFSSVQAMRASKLPHIVEFVDKTMGRSVAETKKVCP